MVEHLEKSLLVIIDECENRDIYAGMSTLSSNDRMSDLRS